MEMVYDYLTGTQFKQRVDAIVERFEDIQDNLRKERVEAEGLSSSNIYKFRWSK